MAFRALDEIFLKNRLGSRRESLLTSSLFPGRPVLFSMQTIVIGHRNPDMDSICAAIGYADLKTRLGVPNVVAGRAGATNERIDFVLNYFGVEAPMLVTDLSPRISDIMRSGAELVAVASSASVYEAVQLIKKTEVRGLPVVDENGKCLGLLSSYQVLEELFPPADAIDSNRVVTTSLNEIVHTFGGKTVCGSTCSEIRDYHLLVGAMGPESFRARLDRHSAANVVLIVGDREEIQLEAIEHGVGAIIVTGGLPISAEVRAAAERRGVVVISSPTDTAATVLQARGSINVGRKVDTEYVSFTPDTLLETAKAAVTASGQTVFPVLEDGRLVGVVTKSDFIKTIPRQVILVDHNELSQAVPGADKVPIVEVIDHHRLGGIATDSPILFWNNPVGSTSSIVTMCYRQHGIEIPKPIAGLLMAGLISDTLNLTSPTTTPADVEIMKYLSSITGLDPAEFAAKIFAVGSPLTTMTPAEAVRSDSKEYHEYGRRFTVAQIEEISFTNYHEKKEALLEALDAHCREGQYYFAALLVTDINTQNSILLVRGDEEYLKQIDYPSIGAYQWELKGVVSRKKQLLPYLLGCLQKVDAAD